MKDNWYQWTPTILFDIALLWVLLHYGLGGWQSAVFLVVEFAPLSWIVLGLVLFLLLYRSDYRTDITIFIAGFALGYWGEWWGTTRGVWQYWNGATPPDYLPPLWGIGVLTVYRLAMILNAALDRDLPRWVRWSMVASFVILPLVTLAYSAPVLAAVDWHGRLDAHFFAGIVVALVLLLYRFDLVRDFSIYICGTALGGLYEYFGTVFGEWTYITGETPPLWIAPLWGLACVAMIKLAGTVTMGMVWLFAQIRRPNRVKTGDFG